MNIGEVSRQSGLPAKTIRYYEDIGLISPLRTDNGYRAFQDKDLHQLAFLGRARALGFSIDDCRLLLSLYNDQNRESSHVKSLVEQHLERIDEKIAQLQSMRATLEHLAKACSGDHLPECPILDDIAGVAS
ncbi:Cu(I)-responsive transcriptional regulator [Roseibium aggregatum]|uniref:Copper export regulator n=1 Tax=Roseibium aggregatum TaxID=187304 RepID=A0A0M6YDN9_9HYPH|nr:Cu(I)-responsive transcriptional regulator [Roseibium aggregatum]MEC9405274.1 Cu(I)-responsive transcriptional regulator [Pseudomonadota bacterium]CTQ47623.1 Copper export regulator [Roseibium aggregatum]